VASWRSNSVLILVLALSLSVTLALGAGGVAGAKKSKKKSATASVAVSSGQVVPTATSGLASGILTSTATVGKKFKGRQIDDVNVVLLANASGAGSSINALRANLTAPNGNTINLFGDFLSGQVLGPLTLDDETPIFLSGGVTPSPDPEALNAPYAGKASPSEFLSNLDGGPARGTWTLKIRNQDINAAHIHTLVQWQLQVKTRRPFAEK
jgi:hypothetical protein